MDGPQKKKKRPFPNYKKICKLQHITANYTKYTQHSFYTEKWPFSGPFSLIFFQEFLFFHPDFSVFLGGY